MAADAIAGGATASSSPLSCQPCQRHVCHPDTFYSLTNAVLSRGPLQSYSPDRTHHAAATCTQSTSSHDCFCSPEEAYEVFKSHKVSEAQFAEQGPMLISKPGLMCCLGDRLYPWQEAAPVVMGVLAFGGDWQHFLPVDGGVPVTVPAAQSQDAQQDARKVSYWLFMHKQPEMVM